MKKQQDNVIQFKVKKKGVLAGIIALVLFIAIIVLLTCFKIDNIEVSGDNHYTKEQIKDYVLANGYIDNTVLLMLKNKVKPVKDIPFIAKIDVEYVSAHRITITVYEKALAGCVEYMNRYVYFDQDGYVMEISERKLEDSPCVTGMSFASMELHEKLPINDENRFHIILKLTQLINKYQIKIDSIKFTSDSEIVMTYGDVRVELGDGSNLEEQLLDLNRILAGLEGKKGTLDMRDFDTAVGKASFKIDQGERDNPKPEEDSEDTEEIPDEPAQQSNEEGIEE